MGIAKCPVTSVACRVPNSELGIRNSELANRQPGRPVAPNSALCTSNSGFTRHSTLATRHLLALPVVVLLVAGGCDVQVATDPTFERGTQLLAAGSPKSAIPVFSQLIVRQPDGGETHAMLALAYALDLQPESAIEQAHLAVARDPWRQAQPGWETVALGIAELTRGRSDQAVGRLQEVASANPDEVGLGAAAGQWLTLALLVKGERTRAVDQLATGSNSESGIPHPEAGESDAPGPTGRPASVPHSEIGLARSPHARQTALLWSVLINSNSQAPGQAARALAQLAGQAVGSRRGDSLDRLEPASANPQDLTDAGMLAARDGRLDRAQAMFSALHQRSANVCDSAIWLALVAAAQGQPERSRDLLRSACQQGPQDARALANQLFSVVCALDGRADLMIQHILTGQRLACHYRFPMQTPQEPPADKVWFSDRLK